MNNREKEKMSPASEEVRYISHQTVKLATLNNNTATSSRIDLNPWDLSMLKVEYIQKGLLYFKPQVDEEEKGEKNHNKLINNLITTFSLTLDHFYPLTGRLAMKTHEDTTASIFLHCNMTGAEFIHASADLTIADIINPVYIPRIVHSFFPLNGVINYDGITKPLLAVQVTELIDGIFIGCTMNHAVCDGSSFWHFINSWSEIATTSTPTISRPPLLKRWFLNDSDCPVRFPSSDQDQFIESLTLPPILERFFNFTGQNIAKLKAKANEMHATNRISSLQAILGHVWVAVTRARCLDYNQQVTYGLLTGNRARLKPKLPDEYFGNSVQLVTAETKAGELLERGSTWAAWLLNQAISSHNEAAIYTSWDEWMRKPLCLSRAKLPAYKLTTGSSPRFNMYGNDFGWGRPIAVRCECGNKSDGKITVYPGAVEGSVDVEACLSPQTLIAMADDQEFMEAVTILPTSPSG